MVICSCAVVSDRTIREAIANGASNVADITQLTRAGAECGGCTPELKRLLHDSTIASQGSNPS